MNPFAGLPIVGGQGTSQPIQRTRAGLEYEAYMRRLRQMASDPKYRDDWRQANEILVGLRSTPSQVHVSDVLTTLSVMYANDTYIGNQLMPVSFADGKLSKTYFTYPKRERFAYPDDDMSDRADPNELNQSRSTSTVALTPRALNEWTDQLVIQNQDAPLNELLDAQQNVAEGLAFLREKRQATVLTTAANYSGNTQALAAGDRFDSAGGGDPLGVADDSLAAMWMGRGPGSVGMFCSLDVWNVIKRHPQVLDAIKYGGNPNNPAGGASLQAVADLMEVDFVLVGKAREDTANEGQTASYSRIWGDVMGFVRVMQTPSIRNAAFGLTFQDAPTTAEQMFVQEKGSKGSYLNRGAHADNETVIAGDAGYLNTTVIN